MIALSSAADKLSLRLFGYMVSKNSGIDSSWKLLAMKLMNAKRSSSFHTRGLRGERLHLDHCDGDTFHFFEHTPVAHTNMEMERCRREIAAIEALICAGHL